MQKADLAFGWFLVIGGLLHAAGSVTSLGDRPEQLVWALSGSLAALLLAALNILRVGRPGDRALAWVCAAGSAAWLVIAFSFGASIGNVVDARAVIHGVNAAILLVLSIRMAVLAARGREQQTSR